LPSVRGVSLEQEELAVHWFWHESTFKGVEHNSPSWFFFFYKSVFVFSWDRVGQYGIL